MKTIRHSCKNGKHYYFLRDKEFGKFKRVSACIGKDLCENPNHSRGNAHYTEYLDYKNYAYYQDIF